MRAAGTKASPAVTGDGPERPLRHEESDSCGSGERMPGAQNAACRTPVRFRRRGLHAPGGQKAPLLRERAGKRLTGPG